MDLLPRFVANQPKKPREVSQTPRQPNNCTSAARQANNSFLSLFQRGKMLKCEGKNGCEPNEIVLEVKFSYFVRSTVPKTTGARNDETIERFIVLKWILSHRDVGERMKILLEKAALLVVLLRDEHESQLFHSPVEDPRNVRARTDLSNRRFMPVLESNEARR